MYATILVVFAPISMLSTPSFFSFSVKNAIDDATPESKKLLIYKLFFSKFRFKFFILS